MLLTVPLLDVSYINSLCVQDETQRQMRASSSTIDGNTTALAFSIENYKGKGKATQVVASKQEPSNMVKQDGKFKNPKGKATTTSSEGTTYHCTFCDINTHYR